jgi:hypothetical protein
MKKKEKSHLKTAGNGRCYHEKVLLGIFIMPCEEGEFGDLFMLSNCC